MSAVTRSPARGAGPAPDSSYRKNLLLLIQLRWIAVLGQVVTIAVAHFVLGIALPLVPMAAVLAALATLNIGSHLWLRPRPQVGDHGLLLLLVFDVAALTVQLYLSGGATNPFTFLYLLQVLLGAILLTSAGSWTLVALTSGCFLALIPLHRPLVLPPGSPFTLFELYVAGALVCFVLAAVLLALSAARVMANIRDRDARLAALRQNAAEQEHIVRMGLLASGAAHELGTPLASISVILNDWRRLPPVRRDADMMQELGEMQAALERCKTVLTGVLQASGEARAEAPATTTVRRFLDGLVAEWRAARAAGSLQYQDDFGPDLPIISDPALNHVIFNLLDNALEASPRQQFLHLLREGGLLRLDLRDSGAGFAPEMLAQFGKPYQSSKGRLGGGLGLFLAVNVARKLGGTLEAGNLPGGGALVTLRLPLRTLAVQGALHG
ncbi:MAG: ATP-binding protein [Steroidobacteraceae bacterium]